VSSAAGSFQQQAALWGQAYEVLVKRGVLARLLEQRLIQIDDPRLSEWRQCKLAALVGAIKHELDLIDIAMRDIVDAAAAHLALCAFGVGYTAVREYLRQPAISSKISAGKLKVLGLYCPLSLPGRSLNDEDAQSRARAAFATGFGLNGAHDSLWTEKGMPARADFLLWLSGDAADDYLLVQEYSYDMAGELRDFRREETHLDELLAHRRLIETRGVFARVAAEVDDERFELSPDLKNHLLALTTENKPLYKLCQAGTYGESTERVLRSRGLLTKPCVVRALAITPNGLESLVARFDEKVHKEPRRKLMEQMAAAYRNAAKLSDGDEEALTTKVQEAFNSAFHRLPDAVRVGMKPLQRQPQAGEDFELEFVETIAGLVNPAQTYPLADALRMVDESSALQNYFGRPARETIRDVLQELAPSGTPTLRDLHAAAIVAGMRSARSGRLNILALEGNPGIGKTTAVTRDLANKTGGYLFAYLSPRVIINRDVTEKMARPNGVPTGTLTLTTNAQIIAAAERYYRSQVEAGKVPAKRIQSAVVVDGVPNLSLPDGSTLVLTPEQEQEIEAAHAGSRVSKRTLSEYEDLVEERGLPGVLATMAQTTRELLDRNPQVTRVVLTAALQGFRDKGGGKTTIDALSSIFKNKNASSKAGLEERRAFARKHPTMVVMVDELAGDGAGAPFVHAVARWLSTEFIECFEDVGCPSPFTIVLVISDASLANHVVLDRYLNAAQPGKRTPDKVLISPSAGARPFQVLANEVRLAQVQRPTLHVMTNSFPASELDIRYRIALRHVLLVSSDGIEPSPRKAIRDAMGEAQLDSAASEIFKALEAGAQQVIYFAQDKAFLGAVRSRLAAENRDDLQYDDIAILDASVPGSVRKRLIQPVTRDRKRVFLMTSSGARGVSFPKTDWIIAHVPRFSIECALMEISQLVYRGRGHFENAAGETVSGDAVPRHLVLLIDDYLVSAAAPTVRQWLRQSMDLMTLLVMLRSTLLTRMTGDSGLKQKIAFVPVGGTGLEEILSLMAQFVSQFLRECDVFLSRYRGDDEPIRLIKRAQANVLELFSNARLRGEARKGADGRSFSKHDEVTRLLTLTTTAIAPLLAEAPEQGFIAEHMFVTGPLVLESWANFDKIELFSFEGHETQIVERSFQLFAQLKDIDENPLFPASLRIPASSLLRVLAREKPDAANEFNTLKRLKSPNTWVALPSGYPQFVSAAESGPRGTYRCEEPDAWRDALGASLSATSAVIPPVAKFEAFPWAAAVGCMDPLRLEQVFDDRYFMASNELNLLNTLLMETRDEDEVSESFT
jgi:hypothetical protein